MISAQMLEKLFSSVHDDAALAILSRGLTHNFGASSLSMSIFTNKGVEFVTPEGLPISAMQEYVDDWADQDLWGQYYFKAGLRGFSSSENFIEDDILEHSNIYNGLLKQLGMFRVLCCAEPLSCGEMFVMSAHRPRTSSNFSAQTVQQAEELRPMLTHMVQARRRLAVGRGRMAERLLDADPDAVALVTRDGAVRYANAAAKASSAAGGPLRMVFGRLTAVDPQAARDLGRAIAWACGARGGQVLTLTHAGSNYRIAIDSLGGTDAHLACVRLRNEDQRLLIGLNSARTAFGFTPAEFALAEALLRGLTVADFTRQRGVSTATVRTQLASLFAKAGVTRQAELVLALRAAGPR